MQIFLKHTVNWQSFIDNFGRDQSINQFYF